MIWEGFPHYWSFVMWIYGWIALQKTSNTELWCSLGNWPEHSAEQTVQLMVKWDTSMTVSSHPNAFVPGQIGGNIFQTIFPSMYFYFDTHFTVCLFLRVQSTIKHHCFQWRLGTAFAIRKYPNEWWPSSLTHICISRPQWINSTAPGQNCQNHANLCYNIWIFFQLHQSAIN